MRGTSTVWAMALCATALGLAGCTKEDASNSAAYGVAREPRRPDAPPASKLAIATAATAAIPEAFRGTWDDVKGSCDPASDLRVVIGADTIDFYESHGSVTRVRLESADSVVVDLAMEGEGEKWTMSERYTLSDGGTTLTPAAVGETQGEPIPLKRCPAASVQ